MGGFESGDQENTEEIPERPLGEVLVPDAITENVPARVRIIKSDLEKYGYTPGCLGCRQVLMGSKKNAGHSEPCRARMYPLLLRDDSNKHRFENADIRKKEWSEGNGKGAEDIEVKRRRLGKDNVEDDPSIQGGDKRDMVREALGESTDEPSAKKARAEQAADEGDVVIQGQTGGSSGSASERIHERSEDDERENMSAKKQRIYTIKDSNQKLYKEYILGKIQSKALAQLGDYSIVELYSPPRTSALTETYGISSNGSFDN